MMLIGHLRIPFSYAGKYRLLVHSDKELDEGRRVRFSTVRFVETKASRKRCLVW